MLSVERGLPWICAVVAVAAGVVAMAPKLDAAHWSPESLVHVGKATQLAAVARRGDRDFPLVQGVGYDGQFYWAIALDPFASGGLKHAFDKASYRYGHPLLGWLAGLAAAGRTDAVPVALLVLGLVGSAAAAFAAAALAVDIGRNGWLGLWVALSPGLATAAALDLGEPLAAAVVLWAVRAFLARRRVAAWVLLAVAPLVKEPLLLVLAGFVSWLVVVRRRREAAFFVLALLPALAWWTYLRVHLGAWFTTGSTALAAPFTGWWSSLVVNPSGRLDAAEVTALVAVLATIAAGAVAAAVRFGPLSVAYLCVASLAFSLAGNATAAFTTALRTTSLPLLLVPFVLGRRRSPLDLPGKRHGGRPQPLAKGIRPCADPGGDIGRESAATTVVGV